jgi:acetoin utilization deacetylase AcuC-like enzyme
VEYYHGNLIEYAEKPPRIELMRDHLLTAGLAEVIEITEAIAPETLHLVHDPEMVAFMQNIRQTFADRESFPQGSQYQVGEGELYLYPGFAPIRPYMKRLKESVVGGMGYYFTDKEAPVGIDTWEAALFSATLAYQGAEILLKGSHKLAYALCRPPGHHAGADFMGGYCYFNNAALAAKHLANRWGKVVLLDIDYHHGNGSQAIFWDDPDVLFISLHAHPSAEYPYYSGHADETGGPQAPNLNVNLPLPAGTTSQEFLSAVQQALERAAAFGPAALVLSLGFDTYENDPLSTFKVGPSTYHQIGQALAQTGWPILAVQEGGYMVSALGGLAEELFTGMLG